MWSGKQPIPASDDQSEFEGEEAEDGDADEEDGDEPDLVYRWLVNGSRLWFKADVGSGHTAQIAVKVGGLSW
jgi:hypothetical protein